MSKVKKKEWKPKVSKKTRVLLEDYLRVYESVVLQPDDTQLEAESRYRLGELMEHLETLEDQAAFVREGLKRWGIG